MRMESSPTQTVPSIATQLRDGTRELHVKAGRSPYRSAFFHGQVGRDSYADMLDRLYPVYCAIEQSQTRLRTDPALPLNADEQKRLVDEANTAFKLNIALFDELESERLSVATQH